MIMELFKFTLYSWNFIVLGLGAIFGLDTLLAFNFFLSFPSGPICWHTESLWLGELLFVIEPPKLSLLLTFLEFPWFNWDRYWLILISPRDSLRTDLVGLWGSLNWDKKAVILEGSGSWVTCNGEADDALSIWGECAVSLESSSKLKGSGLVGAPSAVGLNWIVPSFTACSTGSSVWRIFFWISSKGPGLWLSWLARLLASLALLSWRWRSHRLGSTPGLASCE